MLNSYEPLCIGHKIPVKGIKFVVIASKNQKKSPYVTTERY